MSKQVLCWVALCFLAVGESGFPGFMSWSSHLKPPALGNNASLSLPISILTLFFFPPRNHTWWHYYSDTQIPDWSGREGIDLEMWTDFQSWFDVLVPTGSRERTETDLLFNNWNWSSKRRPIWRLQCLSREEAIFFSHCYFCPEPDDSLSLRQQLSTVEHTFPLSMHKCAKVVLPPPGGS